MSKRYDNALVWLKLQPYSPERTYLLAVMNAYQVMVRTTADAAIAAAISAAVSDEREACAMLCERSGEETLALTEHMEPGAIDRLVLIGRGERALALAGLIRNRRARHREALDG